MKANKIYIIFYFFIITSYTNTSIQTHTQFIILEKFKSRHKRKRHLVNELGFWSILISFRFVAVFFFFPKDESTSLSLQAYYFSFHDNNSAIFVVHFLLFHTNITFSDRFIKHLSVLQPTSTHITYLPSSTTAEVVQRRKK